MANLASYKGLGAPLLDVEALSTASTAVNLTADQQGKLLWFDGGIRQINLPQPEAGMVYWLANTTGGVTTVTKILSSGESDILTAASTAKGVACESTVEAGIIIKVIGINDYRWVASREGGSTLNINTTTT
ncbi:MAG: hypothetical protein ACXABY_19255 [Candidatus Thorarchaeota archaeon]|jgi:hypothetical protein